MYRVKKRVRKSTDIATECQPQRYIISNDEKACSYLFKKGSAIIKFEYTFAEIGSVVPYENKNFTFLFI